MLKFIVEQEPFYTQHGLDEPCTTKMEKVFDSEATSTAIIAQLLQTLRLIGYGHFTKTQMTDLIETLIEEGYVDDDTVQEV